MILYPKIIFISGPTAIGKSILAIKLAKLHKGEIINADSMQVYSNLKILTARPSNQDKKNIKHHLYGHIPGSVRYNVAKWCEEISTIIKNKKNTNKKFIIVGGTGLYINSLLKGLSNVPFVEEKFKNKSNLLLNKLGIENFYQEVCKIDKDSCLKISKRDSQRLKRIWEVYQSTGRTLSYWNQNKEFFLKQSNYKLFLFFPDRKKIYEKVNSRFLMMIKDGAIEEVKKLLTLKLDSSLPIMKAHGVPEISKYLSGRINKEEFIEKAQQATRNYVKRQLTWWRASKLEQTKIYNEFPSEIDADSLILDKNELIR